MTSKNTGNKKRATDLNNRKSFDLQSQALLIAGCSASQSCPQGES
jgi:hypothetical protein